MAWTDFLGGALSQAPQLLERRRQFDAEQEARKNQQAFQQVQLAMMADDQAMQQTTNRRDILKEAIASIGPGGMLKGASPEMLADAEQFLPGRLQAQEGTLSSVQHGPSAENFINPEGTGPIGDFASTPSPGQEAGMRVVPTAGEQAGIDQTADATSQRKLKNALIAELESGRAFMQPPQKLEQLRALGSAVGIQIPATHQEWKDKQDYEHQQRLAIVSAQGKQSLAVANARNTYGAGSGGGSLGTDAKAIADAIQRGDQPPVLTGLYRGGLPVRAELARNGYDLTTAQADWQSLTRHMASLNGPQQLRLRQATEFVYETVPLVSELSTQLSSVMDRTQFPILNRAALAAAHNGVMGKDAQVAATQLQGQIADLQAELAVMFRGGNASTDEALALAAEMLKSDWSEEQLKGALDLIHRNVTLRRNSIRNVGVSMSGGGENQYAPQPGTPPSPPPLGATGPTGSPVVGTPGSRFGNVKRVP